MYSTKTIVNSKGEHYCVYCGKLLSRLVYNPSWDFRDESPEYYYRCDCKDSKKEISLHVQIETLEEEIERLKGELPKEKFELKEMPCKKND